MARKRSGMDDVVDLTAMFPWWVGVSLAIVSYLALHWYAAQPLEAGQQDLNQAVFSGMMKGFATAGQYLLPLLFVFGAIASFVSRHKSKQLYSDIETGSQLLRDITWEQFEQLVGEYYRREGYQVAQTKQGADGGIDLILKKGSESYLVQCKHWRALKVGVKPVRELFGVMTSRRATGGILVTSGEFTRDAIIFARDNSIELINGKELERMIRPKRALNVSSPTPARPEPEAAIQEKEDYGAAKQPLCPKCNSEMILRTAKKGSRAGQQFWGCSAFPKCRATLPVVG